MNFEEMQMVWDAQGERRLFAFDQEAMERIVAKESRAIRFDLKMLELGIIAALAFVGCVNVVDTLWHQAEYFQLFGASLDFAVAGWLWRRRQRRLSVEAPMASRGLSGEIEQSIAHVRATMKLAGDCVLGLSIVVIYGVAIRMAIYGVESSMGKLGLGALAIALMYVVLRCERRRLDRARLRNLEALQAKLEEI